MKNESLTFDDLIEIYGKVEIKLTFQEILESLPRKSPEQIEKDWQEVVRYYTS